MITKCINCGAILESKICKYCGTDYSGKFEASIMDKQYGSLTYNGKTYDVYMGNIETEDIGIPYRDSKMILHKNIILKHRFTLIEL